MGEKEKISWIFDLDDTLRWTNYDYALQIAKFAVFLYERLKHNVPYISQLILMHENIDSGLADKYGFSKERFPESFVETYRQFCNDLKMPVDKNIEVAVLNIGNAVFKSEEEYKKAGFVDGAEKTLDFLADKKDALYLVTRGDDVQWCKIQGMGIEKYVAKQNIFVVKNDKTPNFKEISANKNKNLVCAVDDSAKIINAATDLGLRGIYIPCPTGTWKFENNGPSLNNPSHVKKLERITDIMNKYDELYAWCHSTYIEGV